MKPHELARLIRDYIAYINTVENAAKFNIEMVELTLGLFGKWVEAQDTNPSHKEEK
jgi:hypothetical protein